MEHIVRNGRPVRFGLGGVSDAAALAPDTKKLRPATVGQGAAVGAALGGAMGLFTEVSVRTVPAADAKGGVST